MNTLLETWSLDSTASLPLLGQTDFLTWVSRVEGTWSYFMLLPILLGGVSYLLIQEGVVRSSRWLAMGIICLFLSIVMVGTMVKPTLDGWIVFAFCAVATGGGVAFLTAREPVYAALGFATAVLSTCGILFLQSALFVAAATMIVYAGATIIIFLFVLMFAQQTELRTYDVKLTNPYLAGAIGTVTLIALVYCVSSPSAFPNSKRDPSRPWSEAALPDSLITEEGKLERQKSLAAMGKSGESVVTPSSTAGLGRSLYTDYLLAVELAGTVLLVATIGAIALATKTTDEVNA